MQPSITCAGFNSNWNSLKGFSVLPVGLRPQDTLWTPAVGKIVVLYDRRRFINWTEYIGLLTAVLVLTCWRRQEITYSASDFSKFSLQDTKLRCWDQNAEQGDNMTIANKSFDSDCYSQVCRCEGPVSIPDQTMWDLWWIKRHWNKISPSLFPCQQYSILIHLSSTLCSLNSCQGC